MRYGWRTFTFDVPPGLEDETVLTFLSLRGEDVAFNITVSRDRLRGSFDAYLVGVLEDLRGSLGSYKLLGQRARKVAGLEAKVLEHTATSPEGETLHQLQAYVANGDEVLLITATGREGAREALGEAFTHLLDSWRLSSA